MMVVLMMIVMKTDYSNCPRCTYNTYPSFHIQAIWGLHPAMWLPLSFFLFCIIQRSPRRRLLYIERYTVVKKVKFYGKSKEVTVVYTATVSKGRLPSRVWQRRIKKKKIKLSKIKKGEHLLSFFLALHPFFSSSLKCQPQGLYCRRCF